MDSVYRPATVNIACGQKTTFYLSMRDKEDLSIPTLTLLDSKTAALRSVEILIMAA